MKKFLVSAVCFVILMSIGPGFAATRYTVFWKDKEWEPRVNLEKLQPLSEGMLAILALYSLRAGTGCSESEGEKLYCSLTTSLGLGEQASKMHIDLVRKWFRKKLPPLILEQEKVDRIVKRDEFEDLRYTIPDGATNQLFWDIIRVEPVGNRVKIYAVGKWTTGPGGKSGSFKSEADYEIALSYKETDLKRK